MWDDLVEAMTSYCRPWEGFLSPESLNSLCPLFLRLQHNETHKSIKMFLCHFLLKGWEIET